MTLRRLSPLLVMLAAAGCERTPVRHELEIREMAFLPAELVVTAGDTLVWTNHDLFPHTATIGGAAGWDTGPIPADSSRAAPALRPGTYDYYCRVHPTMHGRIIVR